MKFNQKTMLLALSLAFIATSLDAAKRGRPGDDAVPGRRQTVTARQWATNFLLTRCREAQRGLNEQFPGLGSASSQPPAITPNQLIALNAAAAVLNIARACRVTRAITDELNDLADDTLRAISSVVLPDSRAIVVDLAQAVDGYNDARVRINTAAGQPIPRLGNAVIADELGRFPYPDAVLATSDARIADLMLIGDVVQPVAAAAPCAAAQALVEPEDRPLESGECACALCQDGEETTDTNPMIWLGCCTNKFHQECAVRDFNYTINAQGVPKCSLCRREFDVTPATLAGKVQTINVANLLLNGAVNGSIEFVERAIAKIAEEGGDINVKNPETGGSALHYAAEKGHLAVVLRLLDAGADITATDKDSMTPLHWAGFHRHIDLFREVIARCCDHLGVLAKKDLWGRLPLHIAAQGGYVETIELLLGTDNAFINAQSNTGRTAVDYAKFEENVAAEAFLRSRGGLTKQELIAEMDKLNTALRSAVASNDIPAATTALRNGANHPFCGSFYGNSNQYFSAHSTQVSPQFEPLVEHIIKSGDVMLIRHLCEHNIPIGAILTTNESLLSRAIRANQPIIVQLLIERGENVHEAYSLLHLAVHQGSQSIVELLLAAGLSLEHVNSLKDTPLKSAISSKQVAMVEFLLDRGANINATTGHMFSQTPLDLVMFDAIHNNREAAPEIPAIEALLRSRGALTNRELLTPANRATLDLHKAVEANDVVAAQQALVAGANVNFSACYRLYCYGSMLAQAVQQHNLALVDALIAHGADVNVSYVLSDNINSNYVLNGLYTGHEICPAPLLAAAYAYLGKETSEEEPTTEQRAERRAIFERIFTDPGLDINRRSVTYHNGYGKTILQQLYENRHWFKFDDREFKEVLLRLLHIPGIDLGFIKDTRFGQAIPAPHQSLLHEDFLYEKTPAAIAFAKQVFSIPGLNINTQDDSGFTPLMMAVMRLNKDLVEHLLSLGANITVTTTDAEKETALDWARRKLASITENTDENTDTQAAFIATSRDIIATLEQAQAALPAAAVAATAPTDTDVETEPASA